VIALCAQNSDVVVKLKNQIAELEEEKGNLQLQLLDTDESKTGECSCMLSLRVRLMIQPSVEHIGPKLGYVTGHSCCSPSVWSVKFGM